MKSSAKKARCIYCGSDKEMTKDHVPPKLLFPEPRPNDLFTVPCCKKCNSSFSKDDEYFRGILVSCESVYYGKNASKINKKFLPSLDRSEAKGFKKTFQKSVTSVNLLSKGGIYMGKIPALLVDASRFKATAKRITKGLFYKIRGCCIPRGYQIDVNVENGYFQLSEDFFTIIEPDWRPTTSIGNGIFKYRYAPCIDNPNVMALVFWFYDKLFFHVLVSPIIKKEISQK